MNKLLMFAAALMFPALALACHNEKNELKDAEIVHIIVTANQIHIDNAELAERKASSKDVHAFKRRLIEESMAINKQAKSIAAKLDLATDDNGISKSLKAEGKKINEKLTNLSNNEFDKAYIDEEIKFHKRVIDVVEIQLLPVVKNEELKSLLAELQTALASHLEYAETIQGGVGNNRK